MLTHGRETSNTQKIFEMVKRVARFRPREPPFKCNAHHFRYVQNLGLFMENYTKN